MGGTAIITLGKHYIVKKVIKALSVAFLVFAILTLTVGPHLWFWSFFSLIPSFAFPFLVLICVAIVLKSLSKSELHLHRLFISFSLILFAGSFSIADINLHAIGNIFSSQEVSADSVTIFNFNTEFWEKQNNLDNFYSFLQKQDADIYNLQEFFAPEDIAREEFEEKSVSKLQEYFPNYEIIFQGELISLSRLEITDVTYNDDFNILNYKVNRNGKTLNIFNIHIPIHLPVNAIAQRRNLSSILQTTINLYNLRLEYFESIEKSFTDSNLPTIVAGDFNTSGFMQFMRNLFKVGTSSHTASRNIFPTTWNAAGLKLWQIDYVIGKNEINFERHEDIDTSEYSDHSGQKVWFEL